MSDDVITAEGLTKVFNKHLIAVDHVNFSVKQGEIFGFLGPNGAGKTTTINMLKPTDGNATIWWLSPMEASNRAESDDG